MDSKITKKRLHDYFSYEWVVMVAIIVASIFLWELFYGFASVKPTVGQEFKFYYDLGISSDNAKSFKTLLEEKNVLSYDVLVCDYEPISEKYDTLRVRLGVGEGDVIISECTSKDSEGNDLLSVRANYLIDMFPVYTFDDLIKDAKAYLKTLVKDGAADGAETDYQNFSENFDLAKIKAGFDKRLGNDNRFRSEGDKKAGVQKEIDRVKKLVKDVHDLEYFLQNAPDEYFYRYTKYQETYFTYKDLDEHWDHYKDQYRPLYEAEVLNRPNARYALNVGALSGGANPSLYFKKAGATDSTDVVIMAFNFKEMQPELQFECVSFMSMIVREFSDVIPQ